jgi:hypothetical protein
MDIPLALRETKDGRVIYSIPWWYRVLMLVIGAVLLGAVLVAGDKPSVIEWVALALALAAALYEERWVLDPGTKTIRHRFGLLFAARSVSLPFDRIEGFRLRAFVRGSTPGGPAEAEESKRILEAADPTGDANALGERRSRLKKAYVTLLCDDLEGGALVINTLPARRVPDLKAAGALLSRIAEKPFSKG